MTVPALLLTTAATRSGGTRAVDGATGVALDVLDLLGEVGVGLLVLVETVVPPVPSEVVLPLAGTLAADGRLGLAALLVWSTVGAVAGALVLHELGARLGSDRVAGLLARVPLVSRDDVDRGARWFDRHGGVAVLTGRCVPGVRSVVSVPAGARGMPRGRFVLLTAVGSLAWNAALVGVGVAVGQRARAVRIVGDVADVALLVVVVGTVVALAVRRWRAR